MTATDPEATDKPHLLVDGQYGHIENFGQAIGWEIDFRQIDPGPLESHVTVFGVDQFTIFRVELNRSFHQLGHPPEGLMTFGLPDTSSGPLRWNGAESPAGVLINFNYESELDCVNPAGEFGGYILCLTPERFSLGGRQGGVAEDSLRAISDSHFWHPETGQHERLRELLNLLTTVARNEGDDGLHRWNKVFNLDVPVLLAQIVAGDSYLPDTKKPQFRSAALKRAIEVLGNYEQLPDNVESLCQMAYCSWDTLRRAFKEEFGLSPKAYMNAIRLAAVQPELVRLGPGTGITNVANKRVGSHAI